MRYYIIEHQKRPDGEINVSEVSRTTFAGGLSYYHERYSKMVVNDQFVSVSIMLVDENLTVIEQATIETLYRPVTNETEPAEQETQGRTAVDEVV